jgi:prepilin-type N-terminal cleavage/methylation domain-containing protein
MRSRNSSRGFTLIEILVAMTILGMSFAVLFSLSSRSLDGMRRSRAVQERIDFAKNKLDELRLVSDLEAGDRVTGALEDGTEWTVDVLPFVAAVPDGPRRNPNSVVRVRVTLDWQGRNAPQSWSVDAYRLVRPRPLGVPHIALGEQLRAVTPR